jgi:peptidoglycan/xylan/chitin deacetylase (PgdA/CDA1 family)
MQLKTKNIGSLFIGFAKESIGYLYKHIGSLKNKNSLVVFCYHEITDNPSKFQINNCLYTSTNTFRLQIDWIKNNFEIINPRNYFDKTKSCIICKPQAMITFDDGYYGTFENGIKILLDKSIPSLIFLNMRNIKESTPLVSATCLYFEDKESKENEEYEEKKVNRINEINKRSYQPLFSSMKKPFHLNINPKEYLTLEPEIKKNESNILEYQGSFANIELLKKYDGSDLVSYGNHLFEHFNAIALSKDELYKNYKDNVIELKKFNSYLNMFAYTNGRHGTCWNDSTSNLIKEFGALKIFSADGKINSNPTCYVVDRIALNENYNNINKLNYCIFRGSI